MGAVAAGITAAAAVAGVGASLYNGAQSSAAATKAGQQAADATKYAADLSYQQNQQTRSDLAPFRSLATTDNLGTLSNYYKQSNSDLGTAFGNAQSAADSVG